MELKKKKKGTICLTQLDCTASRRHFLKITHTMDYDKHMGLNCRILLQPPAIYNGAESEASKATWLIDPVEETCLVLY